MRNIRSHAILVAALMLAGCFSVPYRYVELNGENVEIAETGRPPVDVGHFFGDPFPMRHALEEPGVSLTLAAIPPTLDGGANLHIVSSVPIRAVSIDQGDAFARSPFAWGLRAFPANVGDVVQIRIDLEDRADPVLMSGAIAEAGKIMWINLAGP